MAVVNQDVRLLIAIVNAEFLVLARHRTLFAEIGCAVAVSEPAVVTACIRKIETFRFFRQNCFATPATEYLSEMVANQWSSFPAIVKPNTGSGGRNTFRADTPHQLQAFRTIVPDPIVQEFVEGPEYTIDVLADFSGQVVASVPRLRVETKAGVCSRARTVRDSRLIDVALDFDGTMVDLPVEWRRVHAELDDLYLRWGVSSSVRSLFPRLDDALAHLAATLDRQAFRAKRREALDVLDAAESAAADSATPIPGAIAFTKGLANAGMRWGVTTNNAATPVLVALARLGFETPPIVVGRDDVYHFKPAPDCLTALAEFHGSPPGRLVMIGDSDHDVAAAGVYGARSIYLKRPGHRAPFFARPWRIARSFNDVARLVAAASTEMETH